MAIGEVAQKLSLSNATVTGIVDRMLQRKLLSKERSVEDRRKFMVQATEKGKKILEKAPSLLQEQFIRRFGKLEDWEQNLILSTMQRVALMMNANQLEAASILTTGPLEETAQETLEFLSTPTRPAKKKK